MVAFKGILFIEYIMADSRESFYTKDEQPIRAGGCIFYRKIKNDIEILLINNKRNIFIKNKPIETFVFEDIGGKISHKDNMIEDMIAREISEETNNIITESLVMSLLVDREDDTIYHKSTKYLLYIVEANEEIAHLKTEDFGKKEVGENTKERTFHWIKLSRFKKHIMLNYRLFVIKELIINMLYKLKITI